MISPAAMRAMRAAVDWSMRDLAKDAGIALGTVLRIEGGEPCTQATERRIRSAFRKRGVAVVMMTEGFSLRVRQPPTSIRFRIAEELAATPYVRVYPARADGSHPVCFEVPRRLRPEGWPASRPLPFDGRRGRLDDPAEVERIKRDAAAALAQLHAARAGMRPERPSGACRKAASASGMSAGTRGPGQPPRPS